mmetsp:Transcript_6453/g.10578  ORF Transcript_6453/g.10578 Transcript_6453/m.10578 type:complete len:240 (+) Transcript_6453:1-720(+)
MKRKHAFEDVRGGSRFVECPVCGQSFYDLLVSEHVEQHFSNGANLSTPRRSPKTVVDSVPGLSVFPDFLSMEEEQALITAVEVSAPAWNDARVRRVKNYGPVYDVKQRRFAVEVDWSPLPSYVPDLVDAIRFLSPFADFSPNQLAVNEYRSEKKSHILPHNDTENGDIGQFIMGISLSVDAYMTFSHGNHRVSVFLPARGLYAMSGECLQVWRHALFPGQYSGRRISLTFREVRFSPQG